jgi:GntR family transcriptional regulator/MocR family aminotransferase
LRHALDAFLRRSRGLSGRDLLLTHGSQEAIALIAQAMVGPGDAVAVEDPGYPPAWQAFRAAGATLVRVPVDESGMRVDGLRGLLREHPVRLVYVTPCRQYPTTVSLAPARRTALIAATREAGVPILEDDYDHEHHFHASPPPPLAVLGAYSDHVIYVSTLSKAIAPGIRIGFVAAANEVIARLVRLRRVGTRGNDAITQAAVADWIEQGGFERHLRRARRTYRARRDSALAAIGTLQAHGVDVSAVAPEGGLALWTRWDGIDTWDLAVRARERGVLFLPERVLRLEASNPWHPWHGARFAFSRLPAETFAEALAIVADEARKLVRARGTPASAARTNGRRRQG